MGKLDKATADALVKMGTDAVDNMTTRVTADVNDMKSFEKKHSASEWETKLVEIIDSHKEEHTQAMLNWKINFDELHSSESGDQSSEAGKLYLDTRHAFEAAENTVLSALDKLKKDTDKLAKQDFSSITAFQSQATSALSAAKHNIVQLGASASK